MALHRQQTTTPALSWRWNWKLLSFSGIFLPLTVVLGFWQLQRADEKSLLLELQQQRETSGPQPFANISAAADNQYLAVRVAGHFDNERTVLLDNRVRRGQPGYEAVSLFKVAGSDQCRLVNRGWIAGSLDRRVLPPVPKVTGEQILTGHLYRQTTPPLRLGDNGWRQQQWPQVVQSLLPAEAEPWVGEKLFPYVLRLDQRAPGALHTGWTIVNVQPGKHVGYAVQWFAMAATLLILTVFASSNLGAVVCGRFGKTGDGLTDE